jgi:hypothetical protein
LSSSRGRNQPQLLGRGGLERELYLANIQTLDGWPVLLESPQPHFVALLAMDARSVDRDEIGALAKKLIDQGMVYLCAWGPDCKRVHDVFDVAKAGRVETDDAFVLTDWFEEEDLDDALWDAVFAPPAEAYIDTCRAVVAIVVDQPGWSERVEAALGDFQSFNERVLARDGKRG